MVALVFLAALQIPKIVAIVPQQEGFFDKKAEYQGITIRANSAVSDAAIVEGYRRIGMVLMKMPNAAVNLAKAGAGLDIIGKDQVTSDLPEFRHLKGKPFQGKPTEKITTIDERTRGMGG